eukprot:TRINITY_DN7442_c0_g1_i1.p1 TRINITY_DN7442_c0_g1~~TRINITY_DN7442_c0_g1_i1.p1  ORF type:complete len:363 (+),score=90.31 TRINITY_DN7442_c0_g1_i1:20-1108(+)
MPIEFRNEFIQEFFGGNQSVNDEQIVHAFDQNFSQLACLSPQGRTRNNTLYGKMAWSPASCGESSYSCFDFTCETPLYYERNGPQGRVGSGCFFTLYRVLGRKEICEDNFICNHDPSIQNEQECLEAEPKGFCGYCSPSGLCTKVTEEVSEEECYQLRSGCLVQGELLISNSNNNSSSGSSTSDDNNNNNYYVNETECSNRLGFCSLPCSESDDISSSSYLCSKEECEKRGVCSFEEIRWYMNQFIPQQPWLADIDGFCTSPMAVFNNPDCGTASGNFGRIQTQDLPFGDFCIRFLDEGNCSLYEPFGFQWMKIPRSEEECLSFQSCSEENVFWSTLRSPKNETSCSLCGGKYIPAFTRTLR